MTFGKTTLMAGVAAGTLALSAVGASAQGGFLDTPYISVFGGVSFLEDVDTSYNGAVSYTVDTDTGFVIGVAVGARVMDTFRGEIEFSYAEYDGDRETSALNANINSGSIDTYYLLANAWYDFDLGTMFQPYVGGGIGIGFTDANLDFTGGGFGYGGSDEGFAFQVGGGIRVAVSEMISLDVGYRFKSILDVDFPDNDGIGNYQNGDIYSHNITGGITFHFGGM